MSEFPPPAENTAIPSEPSAPYVHDNGKSLIVLILGIASFVVGFIPGIIALVMSKGARAEIAASNGHVGNETFVKIGVVLSWITIALSILVFIFWFVLVGLALVTGAYSR